MFFNFDRICQIKQISQNWQETQANLPVLPAQLEFRKKNSILVGFLIERPYLSEMCTFLLEIHFHSNLLVSWKLVTEDKADL